MVVELDYLVIGHATRDLRRDAYRIGGTVAYAARTASALGCRVGVITSADAELDLDRVLPNVLVKNALSQATTTFENVTAAGVRRQTIHHIAKPLCPAMVPEGWQPAIVHVGPVAQECDPAFASAFGTAFVGVTPQGWMRKWNEQGRVSHCRWSGMDDVLARADAVVLSLEDVAGNWGLVAEYAQQTRLLAVTLGSEGCTVFAEGQSRHFPLPVVDEVDSTGAGDIFAASFFFALERGGARSGTGDSWAAARFANCIAVRSVTRSGLSSTPTSAEVTRCRRALRHAG
jgi:sugar/nucleoside kinase (ribokinase family)